MKRQKKQLVFLAVILLLGIAGLLALQHYNKSKEEEQAKQEEAEKVYVTGLDENDVTGFSYLYNGVALEFTKEEDTWYYTGDRSVSLDQDAVSAMVNTMTTLTAQQELTEYGELSEYGLNTPSNTITLTTEDGTVSVYVGSQNSMLGQYYVKTSESDSLYLVSGTVYSTFQKGVTELTAQEEADTETEEVSAVETESTEAQ